MEIAKEITRGALMLGDDAVLEDVSAKEKPEWLVESILQENPFSTSELLDNSRSFFRCMGVSDFIQRLIFPNSLAVGFLGSFLGFMQKKIN